MNFNSRAMTTHLLTILFATCSVAFTPFLYFSTLLLGLFVCTCRYSCGRRFSSSSCVVWIKTITIITVVCVYIVSTAITCKRGQGSNVSTTPLWQWGFRQCLPFSWTTLRGKNCWDPIAVMGVVDTFRQELPTDQWTDVEMM